jgi:CubicO group peptidase (beta-lactamase class C family)
MIGLAVAEGFIKSIDEPITAYIPELLERDSRFADIKIRDLISMSSGIHYQESGLPPGDDAKTYYWPDMRELALERTTIDEAAGVRFLYNNYNPLLEGMIIERATGMSVTDYLASRIWQPMGAEYGGSWSLDSAESGFEKMESGINARTVDFAKFGLVFLGQGTIAGRSVVPAQWVEEATTPSHPMGSSWYSEAMADLGRFGYGFHWWIVDGDHGYDFSAEGNHGQFVYVSPQTGIVIARNGRSYGLEGWEWLAKFYDLASHLRA